MPTSLLLLMKVAVDPAAYPAESARIFRVIEGNPPRLRDFPGLAIDRGGCANRVARSVGVEVTASRYFEAPPIPLPLSWVHTVAREREPKRPDVGDRPGSPVSNVSLEPTRQDG
jgi:hypothetical protein